jgi:hypothetical protein
MSATTTSSTTHQPDPPAGTGRDAAGRFTAGNKYGPGNPFARQTAELRRVLLEVVTPEEMRQVAFTLLLLAKTGKLEAIKLLFHYVLGKPGAAVDPDRLDVEEWKLAQESKVNVADMHDTVQHMPAETANVIVRHAWPCAAEANYVRVVEDELDAMDREDALRARQAQEEARAEANGGDGEAGPLTPDPSPPKRARGEEEERGGGAARGGRPAKPQAAAPRAEANGGNGVERPEAQPAGPPKANGVNGDAGGRGRGQTATDAQTPPRPAEANGRNGRHRKKRRR